MSLNSWGGRLHEPLIDYLATADPDVLCLQEVLRSDTGAGWLTYRDQGAQLQQRANLFAEVSAALPGHDAFFLPAARGMLFDGDIEVSSDWGLATLVRRSMPVIGHATDFVHGEFQTDGWGPHPRPRNAHAFRVFDPDLDATVTIAQLHGLRDLAGKADTPARQVQAERLVGLIGKLRREEERLIVCGDFNVLPGSATLNALCALGLVELVTARGFTDTRTSFYKKAERFADYMLVSPTVEVVGFDVVRSPEVSDHAPLLLEFR